MGSYHFGMFNGLASNRTGDVCEKWRRRSAGVLGGGGRAALRQRRALAVERRERMVLGVGCYYFP
jgi:hypothetical protein